MSRATITETIQLTHQDDVATLVECKGDVLASIQRFTDTIICIPGVGSVSRLVNIIGPPDNVRRARQLIEDLLDDVAADREIRRLAEPVKKQMAVPREALGVLIGKNGDNVKAMRLETNTMIICPRRWEPNVIEIFGTPQNVLAAEEVIRECIEYALYLNQRKTTGQPSPHTTPPPGFQTTQREKVASIVDRSRRFCDSRTSQSPCQSSPSTTTHSVGVQVDAEEPHTWTKASESDDIISVAHYDEPLIDINFTKQADEYFKEAIRRLLEDEQ
ncbi:K Homology domain containing protein [Aphelenchoides avenae]|nr:K Homology domain containing protein [Aphelenchus avenae]